MSTPTTQSLDVRIERHLEATPAQAWHAFTDPAARAIWHKDQPDFEVEAESDLRVGGRWFVRFGPVREEGEFLELDPPHRLVSRVTFIAEGQRFTTTLTVTFEPDGDGTRFTLVDAGFPDEATRDAHAGGWPGFLDRFEALLP